MFSFYLGRTNHEDNNNNVQYANTASQTLDVLRPLFDSDNQKTTAVVPFLMHVLCRFVFFFSRAVPCHAVSFLLLTDQGWKTVFLSGLTAGGVVAGILYPGVCFVSHLRQIMTYLSTVAHLVPHPPLPEVAQDLYAYHRSNPGTVQHIMQTMRLAPGNVS